jgi:hypothetical protein
MRIRMEFMRIRKIELNKKTLSEFKTLKGLKLIIKKLLIA